MRIADLKDVDRPTSFATESPQRQKREPTRGVSLISRNRHNPPELSADGAAQLIKSGDRVYLHEAAMAPFELIDALVRRAPELHDVETISMHTDGPAPHADPAMNGHIRHNALFVGANVRAAVNEGRADYTPVFLSDVPHLIASRRLGIDVALIQVSPPDAHGYCRLGLSIACARSAVDHAPIVIALVNSQVPRTMGNSAVHMSRFAAMVPIDRPLPEVLPASIGQIEQQIGEHVAALIPDRATIQVGIGAIPDATLALLGDRQDLGVHTEMFSDGLVALAETGAVTNRFKPTWRNRIVTSFANGSARVGQFVDDNPFVEFHASDIVNDTREIRKLPGMIAINSAIEVDLTGQVVADSIGHRIYSGIGGQMDFVRGAGLSPGGKAIIALRSTAKQGTISRIVPEIAAGAGVVTTRGHVQYVATEYGVVNLEGRSLRERAELLISIAHPDFRAELNASMRDQRIFTPLAPVQGDNAD